MKKTLPVIISAMLIILLALTSMGCGGSSSGGKDPEKESAGETKQTEQTTEAADELKKAAAGDEFHVGDMFAVDGLKMVYVSSGEWTSDNEFDQPDEGNKYIFMKLYCENIGKNDESISELSFNCYADGYEADTHYSLESGLSATVSAGRSTEGLLIFEVPQDASAIEVEYKLNLFKDDYIKLIYDGEADSGFVPEKNTEVSDDTVSVGETVDGDKLSITYAACYQYDSDSQFIQPKDGFRYVTFEFEVENKSEEEHNISYLYFKCYADGAACDGCYSRDDQLSAELSPGRKAKGTVSFEVPLDASAIEVEYDDSFWSSEKVIFLYSE